MALRGRERRSTCCHRQSLSLLTPADSQNSITNQNVPAPLVRFPNSEMSCTESPTMQECGGSHSMTVPVRPCCHFQSVRKRLHCFVTAFDLAAVSRVQATCGRKNETACQFNCMMAWQEERISRKRLTASDRTRVVGPGGPETTVMTTARTWPTTRRPVVQINATQCGVVLQPTIGVF